MKEIGAKLPPEIYLLPGHDAPDLSALRMKIGGEEAELQPRNEGQVLFLQSEKLKLRIRLAWEPLPMKTADLMLDEGLLGQLRELGYVE